MTKNELIEALQAIPGNDVVILDVGGRFTTDYRPERRTVNDMYKGIIDISDMQPKIPLGYTFILL